MATEIERKFLVKDDGYKQNAEACCYMQGYLCTDPNRTVRIRIAGDKGFIAIKGKNNGISRAEFEYEIPMKDGKKILFELVKTGIIEKTRHVVFFKDRKWEVDEFHGENEGLVVAEIELNDENEPFEKPSWIGDEVSNDCRYYNSNLSQHPFKGWK